jgi:CRP-like cAMP-binding protein
VWSQVVGKGAILGVASAIAKSVQTFRAVALEPTALSYIPRDKLSKLVLDNTAVGTELIALISAEQAGMQKVWSRLVDMRSTIR